MFQPKTVNIHNADQCWMHLQTCTDAYKKRLQIATCNCIIVASNRAKRNWLDKRVLATTGSWPLGVIFGETPPVIPLCQDFNNAVPMQLDRIGTATYLEIKFT